MTDVLSAVGLERAAMARQIQDLVARLHPAVTLERRRDDRVSIPVLFHLTPLAEDREPLPSETITVVGKNISQYGLSFYHAAPLPYRRAWISVTDPEFAAFAAEIDIGWCRFAKPGWYESGGRLIAPLSLELTQPNHRTENPPPRTAASAANRRSA